MSQKTDLQALLTEYDSLIDELRGKAAGGSGGGSVETCAVTISGVSSNYYPKNVAYTYVDSSGKVIGISQAISTSSVTINCVKGSIVTVLFNTTFNVVNLTRNENVTLEFDASTCAVYKLNDSATTATIMNTTGTGGGSND